MFRKSGDAKAKPKAKQKTEQSSAAPTTPRDAYCRICGAVRKFTQCWKRLGHVAKCPCCSADFENPAAMYRRFQPKCPRCEEFLEQPSFEYGSCDGCGSKYELTAGTPPVLLPNRAQREEMDKNGRIRSIL